MIKIKKWAKPISLILLPILLITSMPLNIFAEIKTIASGPGNLIELKTKTSPSALSIYKNSYDAFITEIQLTMKELTILNGRLGGEIESSEDVRERLRIIKTLNGKTTLLKHDLKTIRDTAFILSAIPPVKTPMKLLKQQSKSLIKKLDTAEKKIKPLYKKSTTFKQRVLLKGLQYRYAYLKQLRLLQLILNQSLLDKAKQLDNYINAAADCMDIENDLSEVSNELDRLTAIISVIRQNLEAVNNTTLETSKLLRELKAALKMLNPINAILRALNKVLRHIRKSLRAIKRALKKKLHFKFCYKPPIGKKIYFKINVSLKKILNGPAILIKYLQA